VIGGSFGPSGWLLPAVTAVFRKSHRGVRVDLRTEPSLVVEQRVLAGELEIGVVTKVSESPLLNVEPYRVEKLAAFVSRGHPLARKAKLALADLARSPFVIRTQMGARSGTLELLADLKRQGIEPKVAMSCELPSAIKSAVSNNIGVGILYEDVLKENVRRGDFKILRVPGLNLEGRSYIVYSRERALSFNARDFLAVLRRWKNGRGSYQA
jgi:DNA-binding transcriptional LysR family regulator